MTDAFFVYGPHDRGLYVHVEGGGIKDASPEIEQFIGRDWPPVRRKMEETFGWRVVHVMTASAIGKPRPVGSSSGTVWESQGPGKPPKEVPYCPVIRPAGKRNGQIRRILDAMAIAKPPADVESEEQQWQFPPPDAKLSVWMDEWAEIEKQVYDAISISGAFSRAFSVRPIRAVDFYKSLDVENIAADRGSGLVEGVPDVGTLEGIGLGTIVGVKVVRRVDEPDPVLLRDVDAERGGALPQCGRSMPYWRVGSSLDLGRDRAQRLASPSRSPDPDQVQRRAPDLEVAHAERDRKLYVSSGQSWLKFLPEGQHGHGADRSVVNADTHLLGGGEQFIRVHAQVPGRKADQDTDES